VWTPRRILLLLVGAAGCVTAYLVYARVLGWVDGLPALPARYAVPAPPDQDIKLPDPVSPTYVRLQQAFGPGSPEVIDNVAYKTRVIEKGMVFAFGQTEFMGTPRVAVSPISVAFFGKEKPQHQTLPDEAQEITTYHADKAELEFDRPVNGPQDLSGKNPAKLVGMVLHSDPGLPSHDPRRGMIEVINNQKSADPGQHLVFRTPGPLYYRSQDANATPRPDAPEIWTTAPVEVIDRRNLPRPLRSGSTATAVTRADEFRTGNAVADILLGHTLPPPTMTAEGMKVYLERQDDKTPPEKRNTTGYSGVRLIELTEKVQVNLWSDGDGFPGATPRERGTRPAAVDPPAALAAICGGTADGAAIARRFSDKSLLVIETLGPFRYDFRASRARFEAAAAASGDVSVARHSADGRQDNLICKLLVIDFFGGPGDRPTDPPGTSAVRPPRPRGGEGMSIKSLTATGPHVVVFVEAEQLHAQGTELHYITDPNTRRSETTLRGGPVVARRDRSRLEAGSPGTPAEVLIATLNPPPGSKDRKQTNVEVRGPGSIRMFDPATNDNTLVATWGQSLTHEKTTVGEVEQDLLKFEGGGTFEDRGGLSADGKTKHGMTLSGDRLWLWLAPGDGKTDPSAATALPGPAADPSKALPQRLLAVGNVTSKSQELVIHNTDQLTVWFRDVPPPPDPAPAAVAGTGTVLDAPSIGPQQSTIQPPLAAKPPEEKKTDKSDPPVYLSARVIESWVVRFPQKVADTNADLKGPVAKDLPARREQTTLQYELEKARCEDRVVVHQDPADPLKHPRGLDITGVRLNLDHSRAGSVMTVSGTDKSPAQVHFESISLIGPIVKMDQPNNAVAVDGGGYLVMPVQSDQGGGIPNRPTEMVIQWAASMRFEGAKSRAEFQGQVVTERRPASNRLSAKPEILPIPRVRVTASYRPDPAVAIRPAPPPDDGTDSRTWVLCHRLEVTFDRPVYFNTYRRAQPAPAGSEGLAATDEDPKLKTALCTPMPDDEAAKLPPRNAALARRVFYIESITRGDAVIKKQRIDAGQIDLANDPDRREQRVIAAGPGEVRILQLGAKDGFGQQPRAPSPDQPAPEPEQEMKLTLVKFSSRMVGEEKGGVFQKAVFDDGARVWQVPTEELDLALVEHAPPERTVFLECSQRLTVSSSKVRPGAPAEQWMVAEGNATFRDDKYQGHAQTIHDDGRVTTLTGTEKRLAQLYQLRRTVNEQPYNTALQYKYYRDGRVEVVGSGPGSLRSGR
jgi:hypothetical protein